MGNSSSEFQEESDKYHIFHQNKGSVLLQNKRNNQELCLRQIVFHNERQFEESKTFFESRLNKKHRHLVQLKEIRVNTGFYKCSNLYRLKILFEHPFKTLRNEIEERKVNNNYFKENQILSILYSCLSALKQLNEWGFSHNGIRADKVFIAENGFIKLSQPKLLDDLSNLDLLRIQSRDENLVISPEEIESWTEGRVYNLNKADIYSIGMVMLQTITLTPAKLFYLDNYTEINSTNIQIAFQDIGIKYSGKLRKALKLMLQFHPEKRGSVEEIIQVMYQKLSIQPNIENNQSMQNNFYKTTKISKSMKSSMVLNTTSPPNIKFAKEKEHKQNIQNQFPQPSSAVTWVKKTIPKVVVEEPTQLKYIESQNQNIPLKTKIIRIIPRNRQPLSQNRQKQSFTPCLQTLASMKQDLQKMSLASKQCLEFVRQKSIPIQSETKIQKIQVESVEIVQPPKTLISYLHNISNHTISQVTQPQQSNLQQVRSVIQHYEEGSYYQGQKCGNSKHGYGIFNYVDGGYYQGQWRHDKMQGKGRLFYQKQRIAYDGQWKNDEFHGFGKVFNDKPNFKLKNEFDNLDFGQLQDFWLYYQGYFQKDIKQGKGKVMLTNGDIFEGIFVNDIVHGRGRINKVTGGIIQGEWRDNKFVKQ